MPNVVWLESTCFFLKFMHQISHGNISFLPLKFGIYTEFYCTSQIIEHRTMPNVVWLETTCFLKFMHQISHGNISFLPLKFGIYTEFYCTSQIIEQLNYA